MIKEAWGYSLLIDLGGCNAEHIASREHIEQYVIALCDDVLKMTRHGRCRLERFGEDPAVTGYSMHQMIEESHVAGHFVELTSRCFIEVFSCKIFDPRAAAVFTRDMFGAKNAAAVFMERGGENGLVSVQIAMT